MKKYSNYFLLAILLFIGGYYIGESIWGGKSSSNYDMSLTNLNKDQINQIEIIPSLQTQSNGTSIPFVIKLEEEKWKLFQNEIIVGPADSSKVTVALNALDHLKAEELVSKKESKWSKYHVNDSLGTKVIVKTINDKTETLYCGNFKIDQVARKLLSYIRKEGTDHTLVVDYNLKSVFVDQIDSWKMKVDLQTNDSISNQVITPQIVR